MKTKVDRSVANTTIPRIIIRRVFNSDGLLNLQCFPERLVIIEAGIIGCEYATIFSNFGKTQVYLIDHAKRVISYEDEDVLSFVKDNLVGNGVKVIHSVRLRTILPLAENLWVILDFDDEHSQVIEVDAVFISVGREIDRTSLGLETLGIDTGKRGILRTHENCCVADNIYAAGDITHHPALVNIAEMEGRYAVKHMFGKKRWSLNYDNMSTVMFFYPAVAAVGLSEKACRKKKIPYRVAYYSNLLCIRAIAMRATHGFVKIIVSDDEQHRILGMRAAGPQVLSTIMSIAHFMDQGKPPVSGKLPHELKPIIKGGRRFMHEVFTRTKRVGVAKNDATAQPIDQPAGQRGRHQRANLIQLA